MCVCMPACVCVFVCACERERQERQELVVVGGGREGGVGGVARKS